MAPPAPQALSGLQLPVFAIQALTTVGASFGSLALFCLGFSMVSTTRPAGQLQIAKAEAESADGQLPPPSLPTQQLDGVKLPDGDSNTGQWVLVMLLVAAKSLLLPILARVIVLLFTKR